MKCKVPSPSLPTKWNNITWNHAAVAHHAKIVFQIKDKEDSKNNVVAMYLRKRWHLSKTLLLAPGNTVESKQKENGKNSTAFYW